VIQRAHKIKLKPNKAQATMLAKTAGTARYAYNWGLARWKELYEQGAQCSAYALISSWKNERPDWALEVGAACLQRPFMHLEGAFKAFFRKQNAYPVFKCKGVHDGFYVPNTHFKVHGSKIQLPKLGRVRMMESLRYNDCKIVSAAVHKDADGWYATITVELDSERRSEATSVVGIDVGCTTYAAASDATICSKPARLAGLERQLKRRQRLLARKAKGSRNRGKARNKVARTYQKITNIKQDAIHKFTAAIAKNHGTAVLETLDIKSMKEGDNKHVRKGVQNSAMSEIHRQLRYKCNNFIAVDRYFKSSQLCSVCQNVHAELSLSDRTYLCPSCGHTMDRDSNAAMNLLVEGIRIITAGQAGSASGDSR
jgi:putative transposase